MAVPKLVIRNKTAWTTRSLRPFITRILREEFPGDRPSTTRRRVTVEIAYTRGWGHGCSGCAPVNSSYCTVRVPSPDALRRWQQTKPDATFPKVDFAFVIGHELAHCRGLDHERMGMEYRRGEYANRKYAWALSLPDPVTAAPKRAPTPDVKRAKEIATIEKRLVTRARRLKLLTTLQKKDERRLRTLRKRAEATQQSAAA